MSINIGWLIYFLFLILFIFLLLLELKFFKSIMDVNLVGIYYLMIEVIKFVYFFWLKFGDGDYELDVKNVRNFFLYNIGNNFFWSEVN